MKKILVFACIAILLAGCVSTRAVKNYSQFEPYGIVSLSCNGQINMRGDKKKQENLFGMVAGAFSKGINDKRFSTMFSNTDTLINQAEKILLETLSSNGVQALEPISILYSEAYKTASEKYFKDSFSLVQARGYRRIDANKTVNAKNLFEALGIRGQLYATFTFERGIIGINKFKTGLMKAYTSLNVLILDENGKKVFQKKYSAHSDKSIYVVSGIYDSKDLMELFPETIQAVSKAFAASLTKN